MIRILHTQSIELEGEHNLVLRLQDNGTVDVTVEVSEHACYGVEIPISVFVVAMLEFLYQLREGPDESEEG